MSELIKHFLLVFDRSAGHLIETESFGEDADRAMDAYATTEARFSDRRDVEVVLIGSDSLETIKRTHANYFERSVFGSKYLAGI